MIIFNKPVTLQVIEEFDAELDMITSECEETFEKDQRVDAEVVSQEVEGKVDLQFADGSMAFNVDRNVFDVVDA